MARSKEEGMFCSFLLSTIGMSERPHHYTHSVDIKWALTYGECVLITIQTECVSAI